MKSLYIPTCTMNLNNILGSDSISPESYYQKRLSGNKRFVGVEAEPFDNCIILYEKIPQYSVSQEWGENYPMIIELNQEELFEKIQEGEECDGVKTFRFYGTIHLNPLMTRFLFENLEQFNHQKVLVEQSAENKTFPLYKYNSIPSEDVRQVRFQSLGDDLPEGSDDDNIRIDAICDKLKGAIVAYIAGMNSAPSPKVIELKRLAKNIRNLISAAVNNEGHSLSEAQDEELRMLLESFDRLYSEIDPTARENTRRQKSVIGASNTVTELRLSDEDLIKILSEIGLESDFERRCGVRHVYDIYSMTECLISEDVPKAYSSATSALNSALSEIERVYASDRKYTFEETASVSQSGEIAFVMSGNGEQFFNQFINALARGSQLILAEEKSLRKDVSIALLGGNILKQILGENWDESKYRQYINNLIGNLTEGRKFEIGAINQVVLQSFAAFVIKFNDIDKLTDFLVQNGIADSKYAWAMYGATYGYSSMSKNFTNSVLKVKDYSIELVTSIDNALYRNCHIERIDPIPVSRPVGAPRSNVEEKTVPQPEKPSVQGKVDDAKATKESVNPLTKKPEGYYELKSYLLECKTKRGLFSARMFNEETIDRILEQYEIHPRFDSGFLTLISKISGLGATKLKAIKQSELFLRNQPQEEDLFSLSVDEEKWMTSTPEETLEPEKQAEQKEKKPKTSRTSSKPKKQDTPKTWENGTAVKIPKEVMDIVESVRIGDDAVKDSIIKKLENVIGKHHGEPDEEWIKHFGNLFYKPDPMTRYEIQKNGNNDLILKQLLERLRQRYSDVGR